MVIRRFLPMPMLAAALAGALAGAPVHVALADGDIVRWVDANGVTHFGNPHVAPVDAQSVDVGPANGMVAPDPLPQRSASRGPVTVVLEKKPNRTLKGWRGHQWNVSRRPSRNNGR